LQLGPAWPMQPGRRSMEVSTTIWRMSVSQNPVPPNTRQLLSIHVQDVIPWNGESLLTRHGNVVLVGLLAVRIKRLINCKQFYNLHYSIQRLRFWTLSIVLFFCKTPSCFLFKVGFTWRRRPNPFSETLDFTE
jgi:hypothetical protein